jgi:hypothetical protein
MSILPETNADGDEHPDEVPDFDPEDYSEFFGVDDQEASRTVVLGPDLSNQVSQNTQDAEINAQPQSEPSNWNQLLDAAKDRAQLSESAWAKQARADAVVTPSGTLSKLVAPPGPALKMYCRTCRCTRDVPQFSGLQVKPCHVCHRPLIEYTVEQLANLLFDQMKLLDEAKRISEEARRMRHELNDIKSKHQSEVDLLKKELESCRAEVKTIKRRSGGFERPGREIQE